MPQASSSMLSVSAAAIVRALPDGLCVVDRDGRIVEVNASLCAMTQLRREDLIGLRAPYPFWPEEAHARMAESFRKALRSGGHDVSHVFRRADGARFPVVISSGPLDEHVPQDGIVCVIREVSREVRDHELLRETHRAARLVSFDYDTAAGIVTLSRDLSDIEGLAIPDRATLAAVTQYIAEGSRAPLSAMLDAVLAGAVQDTAVEVELADRSTVAWVEVRMQAVHDGDGTVHVRGVALDITARRRAEAAFRASEQRLRHAQRVAAIGSFEVDYRADSVWWSSELFRVLGVAEREGPFDFATARTLLTGTDAEGLRDLAGLVLADGEARDLVFGFCRHGEHRWAELRVEALPDDGERHRVRGTIQDVTERVEAERRLQAAHDYRQAISDNMGEGLCAVDQDGRLLYLNAAGERLLGWREAELVGEVMHDRTHYRRADGTPLARADCPLQQARAEGDVRRFDDELFQRKDGSDLPVEVTTAPFETADGVRGSVVVFSDISERKAREAALQREVESVSWVKQIRDALHEERFELHAQPIVDLATGRTVQHELLIRLRCPDTGELIAPGRFLPAAEAHGVVVDVDRWVLRQAVGLAAEGHPVQLNLSARSIGEPALLDDLDEHLRSTGADPSLLVFELTETALVADEQSALAFAERTRRLGCGLALDDFGTGYGGFSYLKRFAFDELKIDREFVRDLLDERSSHEVVAAVVGLARGFGQRTVAEGVEDDATLDLLREMGVDSAQGYGIARPCPVREVLPAPVADQQVRGAR